MTNDSPASLPWVGSTYRHVPAGADILDFRRAGLFEKNRWNLVDQQTLYLAGDQGVLAAEWARHLPHPWSDGITQRSLARQVFRLGIRLDRVLDLRRPEVLEQFDVRPSSLWVADTTLTRHMARSVRQTTRAQAIIVPSIAFIDDFTRWNLVVFLDKVPTDTRKWIVKTESIGRLQWKDA